MAECDVCKIIANKEGFNVVYEDDLTLALLHESPAIPGHTLVIPKKHAPILEELDDASVSHLFNVANKVSSSLFDATGAHGTTILLNNGISAGQELAHTIVNVLPRMENDGLNLEWQGKKASDGEMKSTQSLLKSYSEYIFSGKEPAQPLKPESSSGQRPEQPILLAQKEGGTMAKEEAPSKKEDDYMVRRLRRMP